MKRTIAALAAALALCGAAHGQSYPTHPIRLLQGFAPGGNVDTVARLLGQEMSKGLGQPIVVEAKVGAGSMLAAEAVAKAPPDGYTLLLPTASNPISGALFKSLNFRPVDDFAWISIATAYPLVISVRPDSPYRNLAEIIAAGKAKPGTVTFGSAGVGSALHMAIELLQSVGQVKFVHVAYRGEAAALAALLGKEVDFLSSTSQLALAQLQGGSLRPLAVTGRVRLPQMKDVPTVEEATGLKGYDVTSWSGIATTAGTPRPIVDRLNAEVRRTVAVPEVRARLESFGGVVETTTPEEMRARVAAEMARWAKVIAAQHIERQ